MTRLELAPDAKLILGRLAYQEGMTRAAFASRFYKWLARQPAMIQALVAEQIPAAIQTDVARLILGRLAAQQKE